MNRDWEAVDIPDDHRRKLEEIEEMIRRELGNKYQFMLITMENGGGTSDMFARADLRDMMVALKYHYENAKKILEESN